MKEFCFLVGMLISFVAWGQSDKIEHLIYLKDSRFLEGEILDIEYGSHLKLSTKKNEIITIPNYHLRRIKKKLPNTIILENGRTLKTKGYYNYSSLSNSYGLSRTSDYLIPGIHFQIINGYQFNPTIATGLGIGIDYYATEDLFINLVPVFADFRGYLFTKKISPYYGLGLGYAWGYKGDPSIRWGKGGIYIHPEFGLKFASRRFSNLTIGLGFRVQQFNVASLQGDILRVSKGTLRRTDLIVGWWW